MNTGPICKKTWFKELLGLPTYIAVALLALFYAGVDSIAYVWFIILGLVLYNFAYKIVFLSGECNIGWINITSFLGAQVIAWGVVFYLL